MPAFISTITPKVQTGKFVINGSATNIGSNSSPTVVSSGSDDRFAVNYVSTEPEILFVCEYIVNDQMCGALLVWEKFYDSTHYEVFKRNVFQSDSVFERVLFLDVASLEEEKSYYVDYLKNTLGFTDLNFDNIYVFFDDVIKQDRIYEYKIKASRIPVKANDVDYDMILKSKNLLNSVDVIPGSTSTIFDMAGAYLGSSDLAWGISIVNSDLNFFGRNASEKSIGSLTKNTSIYVPKDLNYVLDLFTQSMSLFELRDVFVHLLDSVGGLPNEYTIAFINSIDEQKNTFSYDVFKYTIQEAIPIFSTLSIIAQTQLVGAIGELAKLNIVIPSNSGSELITSIDGITNIFKFINSILVSISYAQESGVSEKISKLMLSINQGTIEKSRDTLNDAIDNIRQQIENGSLPVTDEEANFFGVQRGQTDNDKNNGSSGSSMASGFKVK
jgi:hypothetical protein